MEKLRNGWGIFKNFVTAKAEEVSNSDAVMSLKAQVGPAWENTKEITTPMFEEISDFTAKNTTVLKPVLEQATVIFDHAYSFIILLLT
jgi:hypothetical protein